jgi:hypothetical protein
MKASSDGTDTRTKVTLKEQSNEPPSIHPPPALDPTLAEALIPAPDINESRQRAAELKLDILSLNQRLEILKEESSRMRRTTIRKPELANLQMQITLTSSERSLSRISDLINEFAETMRAIAALESACMNAEKAIVRETQLRDCLFREMEEVNSALSLSDYESHAIKSGAVAPEDSREEIDHLGDQLRALEEQLVPESSADASVYLAVLSDIVASAEKEVALRVIPIEDVREQVSKLQKELEIAERVNVELQRSIRGQRRGVEPADQGTEKPDFAEQLGKLDSQRVQLREAVLASRAKGQELQREIQHLRGLPPAATTVLVDVSESESEETFDGADEVADVLEERRELLERDVFALSEDYREQKRQVRAREDALKAGLRKLSAHLTGLQIGNEDLPI